MRPYEDIAEEEPDYGDMALLVASVRDFPSEEFARELDASVARRFAPAPAARAHRGPRRSISGWMAGPAVALVAGAIAVVVVLSNSGGNGLLTHRGANGPARFQGAQAQPTLAINARHNPASAGTNYGPRSGSGSAGARATPSLSNNQALGQAVTTTPGINATAAVPVAPGARQIRSAQITLTTSNQHVDQVAAEVFTVVGAEHGSVLSSNITTATTSFGGGYASFSLSIPTGNLQDTMTQLSRLHYAVLSSSSDGSQNVSNQYNNDQRQLADAKALRISLLKQLQAAYTTQAIDSIKAQLKLDEQQISAWQTALDSLNHRISFSNLTVQVNAGVLPAGPVHHSDSFTLGRAAHDALRVLVVAAGVALIALAVALPVGLVVALLMWLWVWLRQRRREHALDATA